MCEEGTERQVSEFWEPGPASAEGEPWADLEMGSPPEQGHEGR